MPQLPKKSSFPAKQSPWWDRGRHEDRRPVLVARSRLKNAVRTWFLNEGFIEVETTCLQISPGNETHLHAFKTNLVDTDGREHPFYLHTSPEFACKKLLAAGEQKIFTFAPVFRNRERGPLHHPEFMMLEWYRAFEPYETMMDDCLALLKLTARVIGTDIFKWRGKTCNPLGAPRNLAVLDAFFKYANVDLKATFDTAEGDRASFAKQAQSIGIKTAKDDTWSDIFSRILTSHIEPNLGQKHPTLLKEYPVQEAALAQKCPGNPSLAQRFELYCCGVELANGFGELNDAHEQRARFERAMNMKQKIYGERYPIDEEFMKALARMPPASGVALGFDRLVMLATHSPHIEDVIWTPMAG